MHVDDNYLQRLSWHRNFDKTKIMRLAFWIYKGDNIKENKKVRVKKIEHGKRKYFGFLVIEIGNTSLVFC